MLRRIFGFSFFKLNVDIGLLVLRVGIGMNLFLRHGFEKIVTFSIPRQFSDDIGIGATPTFLIAFLCDSICSLLIICGVATRWCAIFVFSVLLVAWGAHHHFQYRDLPGIHLSGDHGELVVSYLVTMVVLFFAGPGRYSVDAWVAKPEKATGDSI